MNAPPGTKDGTVPVATVYDALASGLGEVVAGLRLLDRDLELGDDLIANLVGVDARGRLTLVLVVDGEGPELVLGVLDALAFARRHTAMIVRHLAHRAVRPDLAPRMLLVSERFEPRSVERLSPLNAAGVDLFELRTLRSQGGEQAYLSPIHPEKQEPEPSGDAGELFLAELEPDLRRIAEHVMRRMRRVDNQLELVPGRAQLRWCLESLELASLHHGDGLLFGSVAGRPSALPMRTLADVDQLIERVLERLVLAFESDAASALATDEGVRLGASGGEALALLSDEELAAFRD